MNISKITSTCRPPRKYSVPILNSTYYYSEYRKTIKPKNAFAINDIFATFYNSDDVQNDVQHFINEFSKNSTYFYNLKKLHIHAPEFIMTGEIWKQLINTPGTFTDLHLDIFAFHSPLPDMWIPTSPQHAPIKNFDIRFTDGIAFPDSASEMLRGVQHNRTTCDQLFNITNRSPHMPSLRASSKTRRKIRHSFGYKMWHMSIVK